MGYSKVLKTPDSFVKKHNRISLYAITLEIVAESGMFMAELPSDF